MLLAVPKARTKLYGERSVAARAPRLLRVKLEDSCSTSAIEYRDHFVVEYRDSYYHCYV